MSKLSALYRWFVNQDNPLAMDPVHGLMKPPYDEPHKPSVVLTGEGLIEPSGISTASHIKRSDEEYIEKVTDLLQELNERLAECPKGVTIVLELTEYRPLDTDQRPRLCLEGTVGKTL